MKKLTTILAIMITIFMLSSIAAYADTISGNDLLNQMAKETDNIDSSQILDTGTLPSDGTDTIEGLQTMITVDPSDETNYDSAAELYGKSGDKTIKVFADGKLVDFSKYDNVMPVNMNGSVLIPIRAVAESIGATFAVNGSVITLYLGENTFEFTLGSETVKFNGVAQRLLKPASLIGGRTMLPLRFVFEHSGKQVFWHTNANGGAVISIHD